VVGQSGAEILDDAMLLRESGDLLFAGLAAVVAQCSSDELTVRRDGYGRVSLKVFALALGSTD
jgi:hypothetical protein